MRAPRLHVLFTTPELAPWVKTGGLGDVSQGLPLALARAGVDVRLLVPGYRQLLHAFTSAQPVAAWEAPGGSFAAARLLEAEGPVPLYLLDCPEYFARDGSAYQDPEGFDWPDNFLRFGLLGRIAAFLSQEASPLGWQPDILHCNEWQCGLAPAYLALSGGSTAATIATIHNLAYQGMFGSETVQPLALPPESFAAEGLEYYGHVSFIKAALHYSTMITTVSPTYAREIQESHLAFGLDGILKRRSGDLVGILNGIDTDVWNPRKDPALPAHYGADTLERKASNKAALQRAFGLPAEPRLPLFGVVSRLIEQKGIDLVLAIMERLMALPAQCVLLGSGQRELERAVAAAAERHPGNVAVRIGFDEAAAHLIEAGSDGFLMPSRFEPSGLNQLYSMRYGTPPIVRRTGGLADSVVDATAEALAAGTATGFVFEEATADGLWGAVERAVAVYREPVRWRSVQRAGMARDSSWGAAAAQYIKVYERALAKSVRQQ